jgi:two-component system CheB/CheR fusion protein
MNGSESQTHREPTNRTQDVSPKDNSIGQVSFEKKDTPVVGIGASAGGLEALEAFFSKVPNDINIAIVVIQHLAPSHKSIMDSILARYTKMGIIVINDGMEIQPNTIYLNPPESNVEIIENRFRLTQIEKTNVENLPVDHFFRSLANSQGDRSICVVLSGTGTDGTLGIKAVKEVGGMAMVQEEGQAKYSGMPKSAIDTGLVDFILPIEKMPEQILKYLQHPYIELTKANKVAGADITDDIKKIFLLIRKNTGHDFSLYKQTTIHRRIERRMVLHNMEKLVDYVHYLERSPKEVEALFKEFLIGVTSFFRDPEAFEHLSLKVLPDLLGSKGSESIFRVWVPGCSTGEEAYSLAILFTEVMEKCNIQSTLQIFASDIDVTAIDIARKAEYPENIAADVTPERLERFFIKDGSLYRIKKQIRDYVVFAIQDVIKDPPFSKLDLISCRNVLIYMEPELHRKLFPIFNFSLLEHGILFLGTSESIGESVDYFSIVDTKYKIYRKKGSAFRPNEYPKFPDRALNVQQNRVVSKADPDIRALGAKLISEHYAQPSVVVNSRFEVLQFYGAVNRYLTLSSGEASLNVFQIVRDSLRHKLGSLLTKALKDNIFVISEGIQVEIDDEIRTVDLVIQPLSGRNQIERLVLIVFNERLAIPKPASKREQDNIYDVYRDNEEIAMLEQELNATKEYLQTTIEELQTTNEELNSTNEEMQSTNEELETSREELQSTNEELVTVNSELQNKVDELIQASNDVNNLLASTDIASLFLDTELRIKRFTPTAVKIFRLMKSDIGRPIGDITSKTLQYDVYKVAADVLNTLSRQETEVQIENGRWYSIRILPYRTIDNIVEGIVLTFIDITELKKTSLQLETAKLLAENIVNSIPEPFIILDENLFVQSVNKQFYELFKSTPQETINRQIFELGNGQWNSPQLRNALEIMINKDSLLIDYKVQYEFPIIGKRTVLLNGHRIAQTKNVFLSLHDLSGGVHE